MDRKDLDKIIRDYLAGKHSPEGEELFNKWFAGSNGDKTSPLEGLSEAEKEEIRQEIFAKVKPSFPANPQEKRTLPTQTTSWRISPHWYRMAAIWAGLLMISIAFFLYLGHNATTIIRAAYGEIKTVVLPDGSEVILNANSTLRYSNNWEKNSDRQVWLDGEAFFSVVHTIDDRKFQVHSSQLKVEVLGTEFNVNNRRGDEVVLHSGKVKIDINSKDVDSDIVMEPGELVAYSEIDCTLTKKTVDPKDYSTWLNQEMILENTSLAEIAQTLEDYYGFEVVFRDNTLKDTKLTATAKLSLKEKEVILTVISEIYGIQVEQKGDQVIFSNP